EGRLRGGFENRPRPDQERAPVVRPGAAHDAAGSGASTPSASGEHPPVGPIAGVGPGPRGAPARLPVRDTCLVYSRPRMETQKLSFEDFKNIIVERLGCEPEQVTMDASFQEDLNADSLDLVELIYAFEENTGLEIPDEDAEKITTVGQAWEYIQEKAGS